MEVDHDKQLALQKRLADSRIESNSIVVSKYESGIKWEKIPFCTR